MERCRGELLRWSRRKKKWNIFPVVWTTQRAGSLDETPGSPRLRKREGDEKEGREESWSERKKQSKTERPKRPSNDWEKRKRWWETKKGEWGEKKKKAPVFLSDIQRFVPLRTAMTSRQQRCDWALGQAQISCPCVTGKKQLASLVPAERTGRGIGCFHHATGEGYVTLRAEFTRMVQHQLIIASLPSLRPLCPFGVQRAAEITPPERVTLFNGMSGRNVTALLKNSGKGREKALSLELSLCAFAFIWARVCVSLYACVSVHVLWVVSSRL